jgi:hypothetical protein
MDVLAPGIGEIIGGSQREERLDVLDARMKRWACPRTTGGTATCAATARCRTPASASASSGCPSTSDGHANIRDVIPYPRAPIIASPDQVDHAQLSVDAHRTWFSPRELRCATIDGSHVTAFGAPASITDALACDIVCIHVPLTVKANKLRRGTHLNALAACTLDDELVAAVTPEVPGLGKLAAGLVDGRQLDEITVFQAGDAQTAIRALQA